MSHIKPPIFILNRLDLGRAIRAERKALGKTQAQVAEDAQCRRQTIGDLEAGRNASTRTLMVVLASLGKRLLIVDARPAYDEMHLLLEPDDDDDQDLTLKMGYRAAR